MSINLKNFNNFGDISSLCEMIKIQYNKNQSHLNYLNTKNDSENFKLFELYIDNIDIIPIINDLICNSNQFNINNLSARRNAHLFKCSIICLSYSFNYWSHWEYDFFNYNDSYISSKKSSKNISS